MRINALFLILLNYLEVKGLDVVAILRLDLKVLKVLMMVQQILHQLMIEQ